MRSSALRTYSGPPTSNFVTDLGPGRMSDDSDLTSYRLCFVLWIDSPFEIDGKTESQLLHMREVA